MRIIDGRTIEVDCDSCACTFITGRGEDGEPDEILCAQCKDTLADLRAELARERDRVWLETFLSFPFKALPAPSSDRILADLDWACEMARDRATFRDYQDLLDTADQAAYYSPHFGEEEDQ